MQGRAVYVGIINIMEQNTLVTNKNALIEGAVNYIFAFMMVCIIPIILTPIADKLGPMHYSTISGLLLGIFELLVWGVLLIVLHQGYKRLQNKGIFTRYEDAKGMISTGSLMIASVITIAMILIISIRIDFKVKVFYDFGEKLMGYDAFNRIGDLLGRIGRCLFIPIMCRGAYILSGFAKKPAARYIVYFLLVVLYGLFDIFYFDVKFPAIYAMFFVSFGALYLLMKKHYCKTYALSLMIYLL